MAQALHVEVGEPFTIELEASGGTGYGWIVTGASRDLEVVVASPRATRPGLPGGPEVTPVTITARTAGVHELIAELRRPWEDAAAQVQRFAITAAADDVR